MIHHPYAEVRTMDDIDKIPVPEITDEELEFVENSQRPV